MGTGGPRGAIPCSKSGEVAVRRYPSSKLRSSRLRFAGAAVKKHPTSKERWLRGRRRAERSYSTFKIRRGSGEEIPLVQGKRNPSKTVGFCKRASEGRHTETILREN